MSIPSSAPAIQPHEQALQGFPMAYPPHMSFKITNKINENERAVINANEVSVDVYSLSASIQQFVRGPTGLESRLLPSAPPLSEAPSSPGDDGTWKEINACSKVYFHYATTSDNKQKIRLSSHGKVQEMFSLLAMDPVHYYYLGDKCFIQL